MYTFVLKVKIKLQSVEVWITEFQLFYIGVEMAPGWFNVYLKLLKTKWKNGINGFMWIGIKAAICIKENHIFILQYVN